MIEVHHLNASRSRRVTWLLEELGVDYQLVLYKRDATTNLAPPELKKVHPLGKAPVIRDNGAVIFESGAIIEYLVREYFPSRYRCLTGVLAAVPTDMRGHELFDPRGVPDATDGRIQAPGVDIVVTTTENSSQGYALAEAAGASSAAAYVSGAVALVWGSPPLDQCGAQEIKQLLFCRSKSSDSSRYPWINVDFLRELGRIDAGADCRAAMEALGCN